MTSHILLAIKSCISFAAYLPVLFLGWIVVGAAMVRIPRSQYFKDWTRLLDGVPWLVNRGGVVALWLSERLGNWVLPAPFRILQLANGALHSEVLFVLAELSIPDVLHTHGPQTASDLATRLELDVGSLYRLLKAAAALGLVDEQPSRWTSLRPVVPSLQERGGEVQRPIGGEEGESSDPRMRSESGQGIMLTSTKHAFNSVKFSVNSLSAVLCKAHPNCVSNIVQLMQFHASTVTKPLSSCVLSGAVPVEEVYDGRKLWEVVGSKPRLSSVFHSAMVETNVVMGEGALLSSYPWKKFSHIVDVGGGKGGLLTQLLLRHEHLTGQLVDLPDVVSEAKSDFAVQHPELLTRMSFSAENFFSGKVPVPPADKVAERKVGSEWEEEQGQYLARSMGIEQRVPHCSAYILRNILHDWDDTSCIQLLKNIRQAMGPDCHTQGPECTLLIVESTLVNKVPCSKLHRHLADLQMMVVFGTARERDEDEFRELLGCAGFRLTRIVPTRGIAFIVEAAPC